MKKVILVLCIVLLAGCNSKKSAVASSNEKTKMMKLETSSLNDIQKDKAYELGKRVLMTCNTSKFKPFTSAEATATVIKNTTEERLTKTCTRFRQYYGSFSELQLVAAFKNNVDQTTVYRYKALYSKKIANKELRVTMNQENKVSSIKSLDWIDDFQLN